VTGPQPCRPCRIRCANTRSTYEPSSTV
jgi:hypothetical protein